MRTTRKVDETVDEVAIDAALELQPISIRLQKSLIEDFRLIADLRGMAYQTLMRRVLTHFSDCEKKRILREYAFEAASEGQEAADAIYLARLAWDCAHRKAIADRPRCRAR